MVDFLHPWALYAGVALAGLPVLIHWLTRPRPVRMPLSTIRFVRESIAGRRSMRRLRDWLVLALRAAAIVLLAWAIGRPRFGDQALVTAGDPGSGRRVVLLDASHSLAAESGGVQLFQKAKAIAAGYLGDQPGLRSNLILIGARPRPVFERLSTSGSALRDELAKVEVLPERANVQAALNLAGEMLAKATPPGEACEIVLVGDFQRTNWAAADFSVLPEEARIQFDSVSPARPLDNLAILNAVAAGRVEEGRETRFEVEIGNYTTAARKVKIDVFLEKASYRLEGVCPLGKTTLSAEVVLQGAGWQTGVARIVDAHDAIAADDSRSFAIDVRAAPVHVLITRQPADAKNASSYFLERALAPTIGAAGQGRVLRMNPANWDRDLLAGAALLVVDHPGPIAAEHVKELAELIRRGRGMLFVAAEPDDATTLRRLAEALDAAWQMPVEFAPPAASARRKDLFLVETRKELAPFKVFGDQLASAIGPLRIGGGLTSRRLEAGLADDVLATLSDQSAFLVVAACGAGQVAVLNVDLAASNLPSSPAFVPLVGELSNRLLGSSASSSSFSPGESATFLFPPDVGSADLVVEGPTGDTGRISQDSGGLTWRPPLDARPGIYRVKHGSTTVLAAAAVLPADEADLRTMDPALLRDRLGGRRSVHFRSSTTEGDETDSAWVWLAIGVLACLIGEMVVLGIFRT
jgi:Aerotolerance regulator N-terminal/von Willebrand factor type A domain